MGGDKDFKPGHRNRIVDDRGRKVVMLEPSDLPADALPGLRAAVKNANRHRFRSIALTIGILIGVMVLLHILTVLTSGKGVITSPRDLVRPGFFYWVVIVGSGMYGAERVKGYAREALRACLSARVCPSCGYSLASLAAAEDGCTVCPECGAAWRLGTVES